MNDRALLYRLGISYAFQAVSCYQSIITMLLFETQSYQQSILFIFLLLSFKPSLHLNLLKSIIKLTNKLVRVYKKY
jgi:hypothetical protein